MTLTVLPWHHASELAYVRDCFYPSHALSNQISAADLYSGLELNKSPTFASSAPHAIRIVDEWSFKSPKTIPHAVTATKELAEAKLHDRARDEENAYVDLISKSPYQQDHPVTMADGIASSSPTITRLAYAMAFIGFVKGFVDRDVSRATHRTGLSRIANPTTSDDELDEDGIYRTSTNVPKGAGESSMYAHAATIGMPVDFVDLRHRCVHGDMPDIRELRRMNEKALGWLWERWWRENAQGDPGRYLWELEMQEHQNNHLFIEGDAMSDMVD